MNHVGKPIRLTKKGQRFLGAKLLDYRENLKLSLREASHFIDVHAGETISPTALGRLEQGFSAPKLETLLLLSSIRYGDLSFLEMVAILTQSTPETIANLGKETNQ